MYLTFNGSSLRNVETVSPDQYPVTQPAGHLPGHLRVSGIWSLSAQSSNISGGQVHQVVSQWNGVNPR